MLVIGTGAMAKEYIKALLNKGHLPIVIGRSISGCDSLKQQYDVEVFSGGVEIISSEVIEGKDAIVAVNVECLFDVTKKLIESGINKVLIEKPAGMSLQQLHALKKLSEENNVDLRVAYNRRFFESVLSLKEILKKDKPTGLHFEFTEWSHVIEKLDKPMEVLDKWLWANSSHIIDLAFFLCGKPDSSKTQFIQHGSLSWHPSGETFVGVGVTQESVPFTYNAFWGSAGRWKIEVLTESGRYHLCPVESLSFQKKGTVTSSIVVENSDLGDGVKPGLTKMLDSFLNDSEELPSINEQLEFLSLCFEIAGYEIS